MSLYENVFIARQDVTTAQVEALTELFAGIITAQGGNVTKKEYWGLKSLSYRVRKNRKGHYTLLNIDGQMIGINVAVRAGAQGIGFAIPVDKAMAIATDLMSTRRVSNTWHGIVGRHAYTTDSSGVVIDSVAKDSPAKGHIFAKTGTLMWTDTLNDRTYLTSKALAGVMTTKSGRELTFAMFLNDRPLPQGVKASSEGKTLGKLCEAVYLNVK